MNIGFKEDINTEFKSDKKGLSDSDLDATQLAAFIANKTMPPVSVRIEKAQSCISIRII